MGEALMFGGGRTVLFNSVFAEESWENIIAACQSGRVPSTWKIGDQHTLTVSGTEYMVDIIGFNHDDYADGSGKAPITFQMHDISHEYNMHNVSYGNSYSWENCNMRKVWLPNLLEQGIPSIKSAVREVTKLTSAGNASSTIKATADKLFLLSEVEVFGTTSMSYAGEGKRYDYYAGGGSTIKKQNGSANYWWLRSPYKDSVDYYVVAYPGGGVGPDSPASKRGAAFAFCF